MDGRFEILDRVRGIVAGDRMPATLSISVAGMGGSFLESEKMARQALDMALGRGGDQAAIKTQNGYDFFGGVAKGVEKRTKVKTRIWPTAFCELIENSERVIVMGHRFADMDSFGAAVGMLKAGPQHGKAGGGGHQPRQNLSAALYRKMEENGYTDALYELRDLIRGLPIKRCLIVVDTHVNTCWNRRSCTANAKRGGHRPPPQDQWAHRQRGDLLPRALCRSSASEMVTEGLNASTPSSSWAG